MSLLAQAIANKLDGRDQLSASYFHPGSTKDGHHDHAHKDGSFVILTLAYQLAQNIPETKAAIAQSIMCHDKIFNSEVLPAVQMECLITSPLKEASEVLDVEGEFSKRVSSSTVWTTLLVKTSQPHCSRRWQPRYPLPGMVNSRINLSSLVTESKRWRSGAPPKR